MKSRHVHRIFAAARGGEGLSWAAACGVGAKWDASAHGGEEAPLVAEFARDSLSIDELTLALYKGLWHALEPGKGFMSSGARDW